MWFRVDGESRNPAGPRRGAKLVAVTLIYIVALYLLWTGAWLLATSLEARLGWSPKGGFLTLYWLGMKLLLWVLPSVLLIGYARRSARDVVMGAGLRPALIWGIGVGLLLGMEPVARRWFVAQPYSLITGWPFLNAVLVAPLVEELTFRGAILGNLLRRYRFPVANALTALFFVGFHVPGWYFQGTLAANVTRPIGGALSIFLLGLVFGFVVRQSKSVLGSVIAHGLNNLFNSL